MDRRSDMRETAKRMLPGICLFAAGVVLLGVDFYQRSHGMNTGGITGSGVIGVLLVLAGGIVFILSRKDKRQAEPSGQMGGRPFPIPPEGYVEAEILGVARNLRAEGGREGFHVVCRYVDPESGAEQTYSSELLYEYPGSDIIGKHVRVYLDAEDPEAGRVDLSTVH